MDDLRGLINLIIAVLVLGGMLLGPLLERRRRRAEEQRRRAAAEAEEEAEPAPAGEPKLPFEDLIDEVFGPYLERRRRQVVVVEEAPAAEEEAPPEEVRVVEEEKPAEPLAPAAPAPPRWEPTAAGPLGTLAAAAPVETGRRRSIEERLFRNPRLSPGAKLLLAAEILKPPRLLRGGGLLPGPGGPFRPAG